MITKKIEEKRDLRVIKTENLLYTTLVELLKDRSFEEIKVSDICNKALINRSTFYAHYKDKYELVVGFVNTLKNELANAIKVNGSVFNTKEYYLEMIEIILSHIEEKKSIYQSILVNNRNSMVMDIFLDVITNDVNERLEKTLKENGEIPSKVISTFYIGAVTSLCVEWLRNTKEYSKEEIIHYLDLLVTSSSTYRSGGFQLGANPN